MKKILWAQNENSSIPNTIINTEGKIISIDDLNDGGFELFDELLDFQKSSIEIFKENNLIVKSSNQKGLISKSKGYFISSVFDNKDDFGRLMPFMFYIESKDVEEIIKVLEESSTKINRAIFRSDIKNIKDSINRKNIKKKAKIIIGVILIIIILYSLWINI
ncbi:hypothetical protein [Flavobacterium sp. N1994]|uniref:hypothetical protein n=1 Tax=Flavobacterium sp. N1994 TaxID=2986827 RepID=UPI00222243A3|nr:hypothetical protein [Flavobacterium sp. N1994]